MSEKEFNVVSNFW